jgi:2,4-dienoyl-CoA reductase (NADPH2)
MDEWGVDMNYTHPGSLSDHPHPQASLREIYLLKRSSGKHGKDLGRTTGWIHRASLKMKGVTNIGNVTYNKVDDDGLHINVLDKPQVLDIDHVVICAGQEPNRDLYESLNSKHNNVHLIGGAHEAAQLDAKRAIKEASIWASKV